MTEGQELKMHIAVVGCGHGEIDKIYDVIENIEQQRNIKVSLLLCCGDFQSVRNMTDLRCMACPIKYQQMHDFHRYYSGEKKAPVLTLFIGGNHEASNYLQELPYGGWVAPNIFYLGYAGVFRFGSVRIAGLSGIYKGQDYLKGRYEAPPYDQGTMRSVYHYRNLDVFRLKQLQEPVDIILSHDWPKGIHRFGNTEQLLRRKPFFRDEIERNELGSRPLFEVLEKLQPSFWFSAHMHVKFAAYVVHNNPNSEEACSSNAINNTSNLNTPSSEIPCKSTKFLALDKVLPRRQFLQIIDVPCSKSSDSNMRLEYDPEWLAILKSTNHLTSVKPKPSFMPGPGFQSRFDFTPTTDEINEILNSLQNDTAVPENFCHTGPVFSPEDGPTRPFPLTNSQTREFCRKIDLDDPLGLIAAENIKNPPMLENQPDRHAYEFQSQFDVTLNRTSAMEDSLNPDEISLDLDEDNDGKQMGEPEDNMPHESFPRSRLILPPPKCPQDTEGKDESESVSEGVDEAELRLLQSVMGSVDSDEPSSGLFFIDIQGEGPESKRRKDLGSMKY